MPVLGPSRRLAFAVEAVLHVAYHGGPHPVSSRALTERQGLPPRALEEVLQALVHAGILVGLRGPRGGYRLGRRPGEISLGDIARGLGRGDDRAAEIDAESADAAGSPLAERVVGPAFVRLRGDALALLDGVSVAALCAQAAAAGVASEAPPELGLMDCG